jgi:glutamyl-tRNA synthetase
MNNNSGDAVYGREYLIEALDIGRNGDKPRKDLAYGKQIVEFVSYFYDEYFKIEDEPPANIPMEDIAVLLKAYLATYDHNDPRDVWFDKIRKITDENGYAVKPKDFKKNPGVYKGHVGDVSGLIRLALVGRSNSPDIWEIQQILGEDRVVSRVERFMV